MRSTLGQQKCHLIAKLLLCYRKSGSLNLMIISEFSWKLRNSSFCACSLEIWQKTAQNYWRNVGRLKVVNCDLKNCEKSWKIAGHPNSVSAIVSYRNAACVCHVDGVGYCAVKSPPSIVEGLEERVMYFSGNARETLTLPCRATGSPAPELVASISYTEQLTFSIKFMRLTILSMSSIKAYLVHCLLGHTTIYFFYCPFYGTPNLPACEANLWGVEKLTSSSAIAGRPHCSVGQLWPKYQNCFSYSKNIAVDCCCS